MQASNATLKLLHAGLQASNATRAIRPSESRPSNDPHHDSHIWLEDIPQTVSEVRTGAQLCAVPLSIAFSEVRTQHCVVLATTYYILPIDYFLKVRVVWRPHDARASYDSVRTLWSGKSREGGLISSRAPLREGGSQG